MKRKDFSKLKLIVQKEKEIYFEHEEYIAGVAPFLRGITSTMFVNSLWKINKHANSSTKLENKFSPSNKFKIQKKRIKLEIKLAYTLAEAQEHLKTSISEGNDIDSIISNFSLPWTIEMDHFSEISALRAARMLWAKMVKKLKPKNPKSLALKINCKTSHLDLNKESSINNLTRTTFAAMTALLSGAQNLDDKIIDVRISEPIKLSDSINDKIQHFIQEEIGITKTIDPWAGSTFIEKRTEEITNKTWELFQEIEELGGFSQVIKKGLFKKHIEQTNS